MYKKKILSILECVKKMWKGTLFKRRAPGNVTASVVQRASTEFQTAIANYKFFEKIKYLKP